MTLPRSSEQAYGVRHAVAPGDWNDTQLCRIMTGWSLSDLDQLANPALFGVQARIVEHNLDAEALVREISASGAEVFYFHAKSHSGNLWFVSRHGRTFSALGGRDRPGQQVPRVVGFLEMPSMRRTS